jgi:hypothetical protein
MTFFFAPRLSSTLLDREREREVAVIDWEEGHLDTGSFECYYLRSLLQCNEFRGDLQGDFLGVYSMA